MAKARSSRSVEAALDAVRAAQDAAGEAARQAILRGLEHSNWLVVAEAARVAQEKHRLDLVDALGGVWERFAGEGAKRDPGCRAKQAALDALDHLEVLAPNYFLPAIDYTQLEPVYGGRSDSAGGLRTRALFALYRMGYPDAPLLAGKLLADPEAPVRSGVMQAIAYYGNRQAAGLVIHKLRIGDADPATLVECCSALLTLACDAALPLLWEELCSADAARPEAAALALGQSRSSEPIEMLIRWVAEHRYGGSLELGLRALGLSRLEPARSYLLEQVASGSPSVAKTALFALATHRYDPKLAARAREAVRKNRRARLQPLVAKLFAAADD